MLPHNLVRGIVIEVWAVFLLVLRGRMNAQPVDSGFVHCPILSDAGIRAAQRNHRRIVAARKGLIEKMQGSFLRKRDGGRVDMPVIEQQDHEPASDRRLRTTLLGIMRYR